MKLRKTMAVLLTMASITSAVCPVFAHAGSPLAGQEIKHNKMKTDNKIKNLDNAFIPHSISDVLLYTTLSENQPVNVNYDEMSTIIGQHYIEFMDEKEEKERIQKEKEEKERKRKLKEKKEKEEKEALLNRIKNGECLNKHNGIFYGPSGKETYYNLPMKGVVAIMRRMGNEDKYWVRKDGCKMLGDYIMVACDLEEHPRGSIIKTSRGKAIVCDTGTFTRNGSGTKVDVAVDW